MNLIRQAWDDVRAGMQKMYQASNFRPSDAHEVFRFEANTPAEEIRFSINPVVFNVPERADSRAANLYIVIAGWLSFETASFRTDRIKTKGFGTKVGYFRAKHGSLEHVYGAHYDIDESKPGHPVFHVQMRPQMDFKANIKQLYRLEANAQNMLEHILRGVRTPTAQMDVFSVIAQICADHLIHNGSGSEVQAAFSRMRLSCNFFIGAAHRMAYLNAEEAPSCYRSTHWYAGSP